MNVRVVFFLVLICSLISCANIPIKQAIPFQLSLREHLYDISGWSLDGRLGVSDNNNSLSASMVWKHRGEYERIELAGPFGQGRTIIVITDDFIDVDNGDVTQRYYGEVDSLLAKHLGVSIPISALRFWVLGLVQPNVEFTIHEMGFEQLNWNVEYKQMQYVNQDKLPRKIVIQKESSRLMLIVDNWVMN